MKYLVMKVEDILAVCNEKQFTTLQTINLMIGAKRVSEGKPKEASYYIVNTDEPYADKVKALIEEHENEEVTFD